MRDSNPTREIVLTNALKKCDLKIFEVMADREGFEPSVILTTTRP